MDIYKTGKFIAEKRKEQGLTQKALAEKVGVTDKAISKWERGLSYPDISLLLSLAECLNVTVTEILNGNSIEEMKMELSDDILITSTRNYVQYAKSKSRRNTLLVSLILLIFLTCITFLAYRQNEIAKNNKAIDIVFTDLLCEMEVSFEYGREFLQYESVDAAKHLDESTAEVMRLLEKYRAILYMHYGKDAYQIEKSIDTLLEHYIFIHHAIPKPEETASMDEHNDNLDARRNVSKGFRRTKKALRTLVKTLEELGYYYGSEELFQTASDNLIYMNFQARRR